MMGGETQSTYFYIYLNNIFRFRV